MNETGAPAPAPTNDEPVADSYDDEDALGTVEVKANKVGILYRCRFVGDKQVGKSPMVKEGSEVKRKAPLAYIEQLGTYTAITVCLRSNRNMHCDGCASLSVNSSRIDIGLHGSKAGLEAVQDIAFAPLLVCCLFVCHGG
jgi:hypothetical protein